MFLTKYALIALWHIQHKTLCEKTYLVMHKLTYLDLYFWKQQPGVRHLDALNTVGTEVNILTIP